MSQGETVRAQAVNTLLFPAVNVLRGIELDIQNHPDCPYREMSRKAIDNLMQLLDLANGQGCGDGPD